MFPQFDHKLIEHLTSNPSAFLTTLHEFQLANFNAAKLIADNNVEAFQELSKCTDPQTFSQVQPAIIKAATDKNIEVLTSLWKSFGVTLPK